MTDIQPIQEIAPGIFLHVCLRCDYKWDSHKERPEVCPKCKNKYWDIPRGVLKKGPHR